MALPAAARQQVLPDFRRNLLWRKTRFGELHGLGQALENKIYLQKFIRDLQDQKWSPYTIFCNSYSSF